MAKKKTNKQIAQIVDSEGLDYAIQHYMGSEEFEDRSLARAWDEAREALSKVESLLPDVSEEDEDESEDD